MQNVSKRNLLLPITFTLAGAFLYFPALFRVSWDLSLYLSYALNVVNGHGFADPGGVQTPLRFGFVFMLAALEKVFGTTLLPVALFETAWSLLFFWGLFLVGKKLYGVKAGLVAVLLMMLSPDWIFWLPRHIDPVWPALLFFSLYFLLRLDESKVAFFLCALFAALACYIKGLAVFFILVPVAFRLLNIKKFGWRNLALFYSIFLVMLLAGRWIESAFLISPFPPLDHDRRYLQVINFVMGDFNLTGVMNLLVYGFEGVWKYFFPRENSTGLLPYFPLLPVCLAAVFLKARSAVTNSDKNNRILWISILVFLPYMGLAGQLGLRPSQLLFVIGLLYLALASEILLHIRNPGIAAAVIVLLISLQAFYGTRARPAYQQNIAYQAINHNRLFSAYLRGDSLAEWYRPLMDKGNIIVGSIPYQAGLFFKLQGRVPVYNMPFEQKGPLLNWPDYRIAPDDELYDYVTLRKSMIGMETPPFFYLSLKHFKNYLERRDIRYIIISPSGLDSTLLPLFSKMPGLEEISLPARNRELSMLSAFQVTDIQKLPAELPNAINNNVLKFLDTRKNKSPQTYLWYKNALDKHGFDITGDNVF